MIDTTVHATAFTPVAAIAGGALIGLAAVMLMALNGRIAGISGIAGGLLGRGTGDRAWRAAFIAGLIGAPLIYMLFSSDRPNFSMPVSAPLLILAGVLVGIGTQLGSGCTSGHGVCGTARLSVRSMVATVSFMTTGIVTVFLLRHVF